MNEDACYFLLLGGEKVESWVVVHKSQDAGSPLPYIPERPLPRPLLLSNAVLGSRSQETFALWDKIIF